jgi:hypothetical protein
MAPVGSISAWLSSILTTWLSLYYMLYFASAEGLLQLLVYRRLCCVPYYEQLRGRRAWPSLLCWHRH